MPVLSSRSVCRPGLGGEEVGTDTSVVSWVVSTGDLPILVVVGSARSLQHFHQPQDRASSSPSRGDPWHWCWWQFLDLESAHAWQPQCSYEAEPEPAAWGKPARAKAGSGPLAEAPRTDGRAPPPLNGPIIFYRVCAASGVAHFLPGAPSSKGTVWAGGTLHRRKEHRRHRSGGLSALVPAGSGKGPSAHDSWRFAHACTHIQN